jgi:endonuclease/exonuclease/phosphatase family metal-dependent hydrolase
LPNHFKSKFSGNSRASRDKRKLQARTVAGIYRRLCSEGHENVVVLGDLNDTADSEELAPLFCDTDLVDAALHPAFTEVEFRGRSGRGLGTFGLGNDSDRIDYILLSPALSRRMVRGGICRKGAWPGVRPKRWTVFPTLTETVHAASDHHAIWVDLDL